VTVNGIINYIARPRQDILPRRVKAKPLRGCRTGLSQVASRILKRRGPDSGSGSGIL